MKCDLMKNNACVCEKPCVKLISYHLGVKEVADMLIEHAAFDFENDKMIIPLSTWHDIKELGRIYED